MASPVSSISSISSMSSSSSSEWYSSSSEEDAIMHNMIMNAAQVFMAADEGSSQRLTRRAKCNRSFTVSGVEYRRGYYLADGIYPTYSTIVKTIPHPTDDKRKKFAKFQEGARKDIERAFGVLQKKWHIISIPARSQTPRRLRHIMYACIILHNMIIEDEGRAICDYDENASTGNSVPVSEEQQDLNAFALRNEYTHHNLQADLVEYIWNNAQNEPAHHMEDED
ncbi:putative harbinger transposase-derived protein [Helianthus annuus]|nr:putative harbinger transposase-derived protein [Helianthus annuus]